MQAFWHTSSKSYTINEIENKDLGLLLAALTISAGRTGDEEFKNLYDKLRTALDEAEGFE